MYGTPSYHMKCRHEHHMLRYTLYKLCSQCVVYFLINSTITRCVSQSYSQFFRKSSTTSSVSTSTLCRNVCYLHRNRAPILGSAMYYSFRKSSLPMYQTQFFFIGLRAASLLACPLLSFHQTLYCSMSISIICCKLFEAVLGRVLR